MPTTAAVFFDVDFTLIQPGRRFQGDGYTESCARHGLCLDPLAFDRAVREAADILDTTEQRYHDELFIRYTARIIEAMGGTGPNVMLAASEIYADWAEHSHFHLYDDVPATWQRLRDEGVRIGLISNSHRRLQTFADHFGLPGLVDVTVSSSEFGVMKPDPRIFTEALDLMGVAATEALMVGDSIPHDVEGARGVGMRALWLDRGRTGAAGAVDHPTIHTLIDVFRYL